MGQVSSGGVKSKDEDAFALLFSKLDLERDSRKMQEAKLEQAGSIVSGLDDMLRGSETSWVGDAKRAVDPKARQDLASQAYGILFELEPHAREDMEMKTKLKGDVKST